jgi:hypothetical protein
MRDGTLTWNTPMNEDFVRAYEQMVAEVEEIVAQYPEEMRDDLRAHARRVMNERLRQKWDEYNQRRLKSS